MKYKLILSIMVGILLIAGAFAVGGLMKKDATIELDRARMEIINRDLPTINIHPTTCKLGSSSEEYECMFAINYGDGYYRDLYFKVNASDYGKDLSIQRDSLIKEALISYADLVIKSDVDKRKSKDGKVDGGVVIVKEDKKL
jgi:hypothetical protein